MAKADPALLSAVPNVETLINNTIDYEREARIKKKTPHNIFDDVKPPSKSEKRLVKQTASSLHPGAPLSINVKIKQIELRK